MTLPGMLICFTGIDGSGKTTQAEALVQWLASRGENVTYVWSRGEVLFVRKIFLFFGRSALGTSGRAIASDKKTYREYQSKKSKMMRNGVVRALWSSMTRVEHLIQINRDIRSKINKGQVVVCDRYLWDSMIDMAVINDKQKEWLMNGLNKLTWSFVPRPAITFFIDIPAEEALRRKDDIPSYDYVARRADLYRYLAKCQSMEVIDGCASPQKIQSQITAILQTRIEVG